MGLLSSHLDFGQTPWGLFLSVDMEGGKARGGMVGRGLLQAGKGGKPSYKETSLWYVYQAGDSHFSGGSSKGWNTTPQGTA